MSEEVGQVDEFSIMSIRSISPTFWKNLSTLIWQWLQPAFPWQSYITSSQRVSFNTASSAFNPILDSSTVCKMCTCVVIQAFHLTWGSGPSIKAHGPTNPPNYRRELRYGSGSPPTTRPPPPQPLLIPESTTVRQIWQINIRAELRPCYWRCKKNKKERKWNAKKRWTRGLPRTALKFGLLKGKEGKAYAHRVHSCAQGYEELSACHLWALVVATVCSTELAVQKSIAGPPFHHASAAPSGHYSPDGEKILCSSRTMNLTLLRKLFKEFNVSLACKL